LAQHLIGASHNGKLPHFEISVKLQIFFGSHINLFKEKISLTLFSDFFGPKKLISGQEDMKRNMKNDFSTLFLEFFCQSKFSCYVLKIKTKQKSTPLITLHRFPCRWNSLNTLYFLKLSELGTFFSKLADR
jgi:hypothetical protein